MSVKIIQDIFHPATQLQTLLILFLIVMGVFLLKNFYFAGVQVLNYRFADNATRAVQAPTNINSCVTDGAGQAVAAISREPW
jgi:hypothetical protein